MLQRQAGVLLRWESSAHVGGSAAVDMLDRGHSRQQVINKADRLIWPVTR